MRPETDPSSAIVHDIIEDISDRRGLRQEWSNIDDDVKQEIVKSWTSIVNSHAHPKEIADVIEAAKQWFATGEDNFDILNPVHEKAMFLAVDDLKLAVWRLLRSSNQI